ncbi:MAG: hypothetical protein KF723_08680 [Rhizobiaceae bacterium]|nr:hypothetical protein [Rhizobiaceae bacterium]
MTWQTIQASTVNFSHLLADGNDIFFAPGISATSTIATNVVFGLGSGHHVIVHGALSSNGGNVVALGGNANTHFGFTIETSLSGSIAMSGEGNAVSIVGNGPNFQNYGAITSANTAIRLAGTMQFLASIQNPGRIQGDEAGIVNDGNNSLMITNSGIIFARLVAIDAGDSFDFITNTGRIVGDIKLGGGADFYNGASGLLTGRLFGEAGNDALVGGRLGETLDGGPGNDTLIGGPGKDTMTGGLNNDTFMFAKGHSGIGSRADIITDFDRFGNDRIDVSALFGPKMAFIGDDAFTRAGQVRINDVRGPDVIVEINTGGSLAADVSIRLLKTTFASMTKSDFVL